MTWLIIAGVVLGCLAVGALHWQLSRLRPAWPGAVVPTVWVGVAIYVVATGGVRSVVDVAGMVVISIVLLRLWHDGRRRQVRPASVPQT